MEVGIFSINHYKACDKAADSITWKSEDLKFQIAGGVGDLLINLLSVPSHIYNRT